MTAFFVQNYALAQNGAWGYGISRYISDSPIAYRAQTSSTGTAGQLIPEPVNRLDSYVSGTATTSTIQSRPDSYLPSARTGTAVDTAGLARTGILRNQLVFSSRNLLSSSLGALTDRLETTIGRAGGTASGEATNTFALRRAANLYSRIGSLQSRTPSLLGNLFA